MDDQGVRATLQRFVSAHGSQKAAASALEISQQFLGDLLKGRRGFSDRILAKLGLTREVTIRRKPKTEANV